MRLICLLTFLMAINLLKAPAQEQDEETLKDIKEFQTTLNKEYKDPKESPLEKNDLKKFKSHDYFEPNLKFRVKATLDRNVNPEIFQMKTSTMRLARYKKYAVANFEIDGKSYALNIYQSIDLMSRDEYKDHLFLPFTDETNGASTYGGGRYMDLKIVDGDQIIIDFNKAYNPYCAYSYRYSCPKVPDENNLPIEILAGVKYVGKH